MRFARGLLIFGYGLFTIAAQALLFREFVTTFEGNDISVGIFFGSWFLWVGLGAILVYRAETLAEKVLNYIEFLFLCYLPAFILQMLLIVQARPLAGIESYARIPMSAVLLLSLLVNAPVSLITGMLFPLACRWVRRERTVAVSSVYILEAAGSFVGGLGVTVMLAFGVTSARIFFVLAFIVTFSGLCVQLARKLDRRRGSAALVLYTLMTCTLLCLVTGADKALAHYLPTVQWPGADTALMRSLRTEKWTRLLPRDAFQGSFQTAQAEYLYGLYRDQWVVVREGSACETLPDRESAGRVAAIALCQNPGAGKVLVVGSGLGLCHEFLHLPHIEDVTWTHPDDEYVQKVDRFLPPQFKISDPRFHKLAGDVRSLLAQKKRYYDLVILNLPDATSSVLNRYYTLEFYNQVKDSLASGGVLAVRVAGGENIMGTELINLGASTKLTLEKVFPQLVLAPGEETWFVASDSSDVTQDPGILRDRFASIPGAADIFPPDALLSVYLPDRAAFALDNYSQADLPQRLLINRDSRPLTHLYSLLLAAKQSGAPVTKLIKQLALAGWLVFLIPILVVAVLRISYILKTCEPEIPSSFDASFLVFSAGWTGIGVVIVLMYLYQTCLGSLYLHIGVISSLFMVGLTLGALLLSSLLIPHKRELPHAVLSAVVFGHSLVLLAIVFWPLDEWTQLAFGAAFVLCGFCSGCYFPIAARLLADSDFEPGPVGSKLETADHLGASAGSVLTSLALVPLLGTKAALLLFVLLMLANLPAAILSICKPAGDYSFAANGLSLRGLGYTLFGIGLSVVLCSNLLAAAAARLSISLPQYAAQALAGEAQIEQTVATSGDKTVKYFKVYKAVEKEQASPSPAPQPQQLAGYIFSSQDLAPQVRGFGGAMNLAVHVDITGKLVNFHIIRSNETPAYLDLLAQWLDDLRSKGHELFEPAPFADVHAVTGATVSSEAVLSALQSSSHRFAAQILGRSVQPTVTHKPPRPRYLPDRAAIYLISASVLSLIVICFGGFWTRLSVLITTLAAGGIILNAQYSTEQMATVLSLHAPALRLSGAFLLAVAIPLLAALFGNIYCGYICPFGAGQELLGYIIPARFRLPLSRDRMRKARFIKYVLLLLLVMLFFFSRNRTTLSSDPLISIFNWRFWIYALKSALPWIAATALLVSILYTRFWCRYLCPAGAFLSLFNNLALLRRLLPTKEFAKCEFGLTYEDRMDCIYCDKCRYESRPAPPRQPSTRAGLLSYGLLITTLAAAIVLSVGAVDRFVQVMPARLEQPAAFLASGGQPRDVDLQRIRTMIQRGLLSDRQAEFYREVHGPNDVRIAPAATPAQDVNAENNTAPIK